MNRADRIETFDKLMGGIVPFEMRSWLIEKGFFEAPASTKFHGAYEGGLFDHSYEVTNALLELTDKLGLHWQRSESPYIIGMFHDLCKIDQYRHPVAAYIHNSTGESEPICDTSTWEYNPNALIKGHGDKSVILLAQFFALTEEEILCIRYHMGAFVDKEEWGLYSKAVSLYPNVLWTHTADMVASQVKGI